jgi:hypothetical protein
VTFQEIALSPLRALNITGKSTPWIDLLDRDQDDEPGHQPAPSGADDRSAEGEEPHKQRGDVADPASSPVAAPTSEAVALLNIDAKLFDMVSGDTRSLDRAWKAIDQLVAQRIHSSVASSGSSSREHALLLMVDERSRKNMAYRLLGMRLGALEAEVRARDEDVALERTLRPAKGRFEAARSSAAESVAAMAEETLEHMKRWRELSRWAPWLLLITLTFSAVMVAVVMNGAIDNKIDDLAAALLVFILAVFAISPAVLLLIERPLEGLDQWRPAGGPDPGAGAEKSADGTKAAKADKAAT